MGMKKGGKYRLCLSEVADNDTFVVPAGFKIESVISSGTADAFSLGTADGGEQVVAGLALTVLANHTVLANVFSASADQTVYINLTTPVDVEIYILMSKFN